MFASTYFGSLPHRQLRKHLYRQHIAAHRSLPHRQLRNYATYAATLCDSSLPHRPLRKAMKAGQEEAYVQQFLDVFGARLDKPVVFTDAAGEAIVISADLFKNVKGRWKISKRGRERFLIMLAKAIMEPDEIWAAMEWNHALNKAMVRRRYIARFTLDDGTRDGFSVFEYSRNGWQGVTIYAREFSNTDEFDREVENARRGVRLFKR